MQQRFIKKENNPRLLLFFAGWGSDERLFDRPVADGYDYLLCFDYRSPDFDYALEAVFRGTLAHFSDAALVRFRRRICGTAEQVKEFLSHRPYRPVEELREELQALAACACRPSASFVWDKAIIGTRDKIFPPANQREAWRDVEVIERDVEHYDGGLFDRLLSGEEDVWTKP